MSGRLADDFFRASVVLLILLALIGGTAALLALSARMRQHR